MRISSAPPLKEGDETDAILVLRIRGQGAATGPATCPLLLSPKSILLHLTHTLESLLGWGSANCKTQGPTPDSCPSISANTRWKMEARKPEKGEEKVLPAPVPTAPALPLPSSAASSFCRHVHSMLPPTSSTGSSPGGVSPQLGRVPGLQGSSAEHLLSGSFLSVLAQPWVGYAPSSSYFHICLMGFFFSFSFQHVYTQFSVLNPSLFSTQHRVCFYDRTWTDTKEQNISPKVTQPESSVAVTTPRLSSKLRYAALSAVGS